MNKSLAFGQCTLLFVMSA